MDQHDQPSSPAEVSAAPSNKMRMVAVAATAVALLGISIPFMWQADVDTQPALAEGSVTPASSHEPANSAACMADAKDAKWDFTLKDMDGKDVSLASFKDQGKVVLLNFWATWCGPCKAEIPGFVELQEQYRDKLTIIGYSVDDTPELAKKYAAEYKINYPILLGEGKEDVQDAYGPIWGIPASFIISKDGKVCRKHMGIAPKAVFEKEVVALMN